MKKTCSNCRFWKSIYSGAGEPHTGQCRKRAPTVVYDSCNHLMVTVFPKASASSWCGEHYAKVEKEAPERL